MLHPALSSFALVVVMAAKLRECVQSVESAGKDGTKGSSSTASRQTTSRYVCVCCVVVMCSIDCGSRQVLDQLHSCVGKFAQVKWGEGASLGILCFAEARGHLSGLMCCILVFACWQEVIKQYAVQFGAAVDEVVPAPVSRTGERA